MCVSLLSFLSVSRHNVIFHNNFKFYLTNFSKILTQLRFKSFLETIALPVAKQTTKYTNKCSHFKLSLGGSSLCVIGLIILIFIISYEPGRVGKTIIFSNHMFQSN
jgi:hypothetical protein